MERTNSTCMATVLILWDEVIVVQVVIPGGGREGIIATRVMLTSRGERSLRKTKCYHHTSRVVVLLCTV